MQFKNLQEVKDAKATSVNELYEILKECNLILMHEPKLEFFGILLYAMTYKVIDAKQSLARIPTPGYTDGKTITLVGNLKLVNENGEGVVFEHTIDGLLVVLLHELLHILNMHVTRTGTDRNPTIWNLAVDHIVNRTIIHGFSDRNSRMSDIGERFKDVITTAKMIYFDDIHTEFPDITAEELYDKMMNQENGFKVTTKEMEITIPGGSPDGEGEGNAQSEEEGKEGDGKQANGSNPGNSQGITYKYIEIEKDGKKYYAPLDTEAPSALSEEDLQQAQKDMYDKAKSLWNSGQMSHMKGNTPGSFSTMFDKLFEIKLPWDDLLSNAILYPVQNQSSRTWSTKNMFFRNVRVPGEKDTSLSAKTLLAVVDSSGSISDSNLRKFFGVLLGSRTYFSDIHIVVHDHGVQGELEISEYELKNESALVDKIKSYHVPGRGGTSHHEAFERSEEICEDKAVSSVIFLTDYYSDVQHVYKDYDFIKEIDSIWAIVDNPSLSDVGLENCDTTTIQLN